jgi:hypothetical protein
MCPCAYCRRMINGPMPGCRCEMCLRANERASINRNLGALAMIGGDVRGYARPTMASYGYGQRSGGCGCNGGR